MKKSTQEIVRRTRGRDTYIVDNVGDVVIENANAGTDTVLETFGDPSTGSGQASTGSGQAQGDVGALVDAANDAVFEVRKVG